MQQVARTVAVACLWTTMIVLPASAHSAEASGTTVDAATLDAWALPFRDWHYWPAHVIPSKPVVEGFGGVMMTDVPCVYQLPGEENVWYMSFAGFDGKGYQSFVARSTDLIHWKQLGLAMGFGLDGQFDHGGRVIGAFLYESYDLKAPRVLKKHNGAYWTLYGSYAATGRL